MEPRSVSVEPGGAAQVQLTVRNTGPTVDVLRLEVVGQTAAWATVEPREINLLPGQDGVANLVFRPPRHSAVGAGNWPFGVRATPTQDPTAGAVEEGMVDVVPFVDLFAELVPRTARGRRRVRVDLAVDNRGNVGMNLDAEGADADGALKVLVRDRSLHGGPGAAAFSPVEVKPRKTVWSGAPRTLPFQVQLNNGTSGPLVVDGTMVQEPMLPKWLWKAALLAALALLALVLLWLTLLRPAVESAAQEAAAEEIENQVDQLRAEAEQRAAAASGGTGATPEEVTEAATEAGQAAAEVALAEAIENGNVIPVEGAIDFRLGEGTPDGLSRSFSDSVFSLTDIVFQNPREDSGTVRVLRGGEVLLEVGLDNFRDLDYHYVTPLRFDGQDVVIEVTCDNEDGRSCTPAVSFTGFESSQET